MMKIAVFEEQKILCKVSFSILANTCVNNEEPQLIGSNGHGFLGKQLKIQI